MATPLFKYSKFIKEQNGVIRRYHAAHNKIIKNYSELPYEPDELFIEADKQLGYYTFSKCPEQVEKKKFPI